MAYRWESPHDWLDSHLEKVSAEPGELLSEAKELARKLDADQIQDIYQSDMDADGYFDKTANEREEAETNE